MTPKHYYIAVSGCLLLLLSTSLVNGPAEPVYAIMAGITILVAVKATGRKRIVAIILLLLALYGFIHDLQWRQHDTMPDKFREMPDRSSGSENKP
jgi:disulfide bond formation protein DsbB